MSERVSILAVVEHSPVNIIIRGEVHTAYVTT